MTQWPLRNYCIESLWNVEGHPRQARMARRSHKVATSPATCAAAALPR